MRRVLAFALMFAVAGAVVVGAQRPLRFERPPTCVYMIMRADSLLIASYAPPCDPNRRPQTDTIRTWRLESRARACVGHLLLETTASAMVEWRDCDGLMLRRVNAAR